MTEGPEVPSNGAPHYSPDGRIGWNGQQWVPAPNAVMPSATPQWVQPRQRSAFASGFLGCLGVGAAIVVVVVIIAVIGGSRGNSSGVNTLYRANTHRAARSGS